MALLPVRCAIRITDAILSFGCQMKAMMRALFSVNVSPPAFPLGSVRAKMKLHAYYYIIIRPLIVQRGDRRECGMDDCAYSASLLLEFSWMLAIFITIAKVMLNITAYD